MDNKKHIYIVHGYTASAQSIWFPWLKEKVESSEVEVHILDMPDSMNPKLDKWLNYLRENITEIDENTIFVGHSLGCITSLRFIAEKNCQIKGVLLVSGFIDSTPLPELQEFVNDRLDSETIKKLVAKRVSITAKDDDIVPYGYTQEMASKLNTDLYILETGKHFLDLTLPIVEIELSKMI